jgi:hypothetical protein
MEYGNALAVAVMRGRNGLVPKLIERGAEPNSEYGFLAGADLKLWFGSCVHACINAGNLELMEMLSECNADLTLPGSNGAHLLWQGAYYGKDKIVEFLLKERHDTEQRARNPDDTALNLTPLHQATLMGHEGVVAHLITARARLDPDSGTGNVPLDDALHQQHPGVLKLLIEGCANLFDLLPEPEHEIVETPGSRSRAPGKRRSDLLFESCNPVLVSAAAAGLRFAPGVMDGMSTDDLLCFLTYAGDAPRLIMQAIFQPVQVQYWKTKPMQENRKERVKVKSAFIDQLMGMNVALGPHPRRLRNTFVEKRFLEDADKQFLDQVAPTTKKTHMGILLPVDFFVCVMPSVQEDLRVLLALADCTDEVIFDEQGTCAFIEIMWQGYCRSARAQMVIEIVDLANMVQMNFILQEPAFQNEEQLNIALILAMAIWSFAFCLQFIQILGYIDFGLSGRFFKSSVHWFNMMFLFLRGLVIILVYILRLNATDHDVFRTAFGVVIYLKWTKTLMSFRQIKSVAIRILPITTTMFDVGPFVCVLAVYLLAFANMYYALGFWSFEQSFMLIYRLGIVGDFDMGTLERLGAPVLKLDPETREINTMSAMTTPLHHIVNLLFIMVTFIMTVTMMNLFIAMLCLSYSMAADKAVQGFLRSRACIVLDLHAIRFGAKRLWKCERRRRTSGHPTAVTAAPSSPREEGAVRTRSGLGNRASTPLPAGYDTAHVWFCTKQESTMVRAGQ